MESLPRDESRLKAAVRRLLEEHHQELQDRVNQLFTNLDREHGSKGDTNESELGLEGMPTQPVLTELGDADHNIDMSTLFQWHEQQACCPAQVKALQVSPSAAQIDDYVHSRNSVNKVISSIRPLGRCYAMLRNLHEPERKGAFAKVVGSWKFDMIALAVICLNTVYTVVDTNMLRTSLVEGKNGFMSALEVFFSCFYILELCARIFVHRLWFLVNDDWKWNIFDIVLVFLGLMDLVVVDVLGQGGLLNPNFLRLFRILKLAKLMRVIRIMRFVAELRLMMQCVMGSLTSLLWSSILLLCITTIFAIVFVQQIANYLTDAQDMISDDQERVMMEMFGSVQLTVITLFQAISGGQSWGIYYDEIRKAGTFGASSFLLYMLFVWLALTNIITSIFVDKAMKLAKPDMEDVLLEMRKEDLESAKDLKAIFEELDLNKSNTLTRDEFDRVMQDVRIEAFFDLKGLSATHAELFFGMLASLSPSGEIDVDTFVNGCLRMKGSALNIDMIALMFRTELLQDRLVNFFMNFKAEMEYMHKKFQGLHADDQSKSDRYSAVATSTVDELVEFCGI